MNLQREKNGEFQNVCPFSKGGVFAICLLLRRYQVRTPLEQFAKALLIKVCTWSEEIG